jgi:hypothetical protein
MQIMAKTSTGYLVDMTEDEIAKAAGCAGVHDAVWRKVKPAPGHDYQHERQLYMGAHIKVSAAYSFHARVIEHQDKAKSSAGMLRALAEMLENALPDVVIPPPAALAEAEHAA